MPKGIRNQADPAAVNDAPRRLTITIRPADYEALVQFAAAAERDEKLYHSEQVKEAPATPA